jgi:hypothetical protein
MEKRVNHSCMEYEGNLDDVLKSESFPGTVVVVL